MPNFAYSPVALHERDASLVCEKHDVQLPCSSTACSLLYYWVMRSYRSHQRSLRKWWSICQSTGSLPCHLYYHARLGLRVDYMSKDLIYIVRQLGLLASYMDRWELFCLWYIRIVKSVAQLKYRNIHNLLPAQLWRCSAFDLQTSPFHHILSFSHNKQQKHPCPNTS